MYCNSLYMLWVCMNGNRCWIKTAVRSCGFKRALYQSNIDCFNVLTHFFIAVDMPFINNCNLPIFSREVSKFRLKHARVDCSTKVLQYTKCYFIIQNT